MPSGNVVRSTRRTFAAQQSIWTQKFNFDRRRGRFGEISAAARTRCGTLILPGETEWGTANPRQRQCWGADPPPAGVTVTPLAGAEREREILMTSSAPGLSRHHAGTDFDFGQSDRDLNMSAWTGGGRFADAYRWLARNASTFGFVQPYDTRGGYGIGDTTERWHWSYYPIAQALFEFVRAHQSDMETELRRVWSSGGALRPEFTFVMSAWRRYILNVGRGARF